MTEKAIKSELAANVWKIEVAAGERCEEDDTLLILESMKMEIPVTAPFSGVVVKIFIEEGEAVSEGQLLLNIDR